jgi:hypothetical protein
VQNVNYFSGNCILSKTDSLENIFELQKGMNAAAGDLLLIFNVISETQFPEAAADVLGSGRSARAQLFQEVFHRFICISVVIFHHWHQLTIVSGKMNGNNNFTSFPFKFKLICKTKNSKSCPTILKYSHSLFYSFK